MSRLSQLFPPAPTFTEKELPDQTGKVIIITGAASGVGLELAHILYAANATVYIATRSSSKIQAATEAIRAASPSSKGRLEPLVLDLSDLATIKPAAQAFLAKEARLDVLVHNAGIMTPPAGSRGAQGHELQMATHVLGPFLLTRLLEERLLETARGKPSGSVRVVWAASLLAVGTPKGGVVFDDKGQPTLHKDQMTNYMQSKAGDAFLAQEYGQRLGSSGIVSVSFNPGLVKTELQRHSSPVLGTVMSVIFKPAKYAAYTELFAALAPDVTVERNGAHIVPWGRFGTIPAHMEEALKETSSQANDNKGILKKLWNWCEEETTAYQ